MVFHQVGNCNMMLKSGTDFRELTFNSVKIFSTNDSIPLEGNGIHKQSETEFVTVIKKGKLKYVISTELLNVTSDIKEDETIQKICSEIDAKTEEKFKVVIAHFAAELDARFSMVRNQSIPVSNFIADVIRIYMNTDVVIINSGSVRIDSVINEGDLT